MAESDDKDSATGNGKGGVYVEIDDKSFQRDYTLHGVLYSILATVLFPHHTNPACGEPLLQRIKISFSRNAPLLPEASRNSGRHLLLWARSGSPLRALFVITVGTATLLALTGVVIFTLFFLAATANAIIVSLLMSVAAAGGFLAMFFACVTAIYIGALAVAIFFISTATFFGIVAVLVASGWIGFFITLWLVTKKSLELAKHSITFTGSALSIYTAGQYLHRRQD